MADFGVKTLSNSRVAFGWTGACLVYQRQQAPPQKSLLAVWCPAALRSGCWVGEGVLVLLLGGVSRIFVTWFPYVVYTYTYKHTHTHAHTHIYIIQYQNMHIYIYTLIHIFVTSPFWANTMVKTLFLYLCFRFARPPSH